MKIFLMFEANVKIYSFVATPQIRISINFFRHLLHFLFQDDNRRLDMKKIARNA